MASFVDLKTQTLKLWERFLFRPLEPSDLAHTPVSQHILDLLRSKGWLHQDAELSHYLNHLIPECTLVSHQILDIYGGAHFFGSSDVQVLFDRYLMLFEAYHPIVLDLSNPLDSSLYYLNREEKEPFSNSIHDFFACCNYILDDDAKTDAAVYEDFFNWSFESQAAFAQTHLDALAPIASGREKYWLWYHFHCLLIADLRLVEQFAPPEVLEN